MKVLRSASLPNPHALLQEPSAVTIGNFDGCHRGHQVLLKTGLELAKSRGYSSLCLTFDPNPKQFFRPELQVGKLFQPQQKLRALAEMGLDCVVMQNFDQKFSRLEPEDFYVQLLQEELRAKAIVVGHDFRFGRQRLGTIETLKNLASIHKAELVTIAPQSVDGIVISSSRIRRALTDRNLPEAETMLGRPYLLEGEVISGKKLGRKLGFPTANLATQDQLLPGLGVYAAFVVIDKAPTIFDIPKTRLPCILNIGKRPTVDGDQKTVSTEVHILSDAIGTDALYGLSLGIYLKHFIRGEQRFSGLDALKTQIAEDCRTARQLLALEATN